MINYKIGKYILSHDSYMKLMGVKDESKYPGFSNDPLDAFRDLFHDLKNYGSDFISGSGENFIKYAKQLNDNPNMFKGLP